MGHSDSGAYFEAEFLGPAWHWGESGTLAHGSLSYAGACLESSLARAGLEAGSSRTSKVLGQARSLGL